MSVAAALLVVLIPGYLPALALTRSRWLSVPAASVVCVGLGGIAGVACVLLRISVIPCALVLFGAANAAAIVVLRRSRRAAEQNPSPIVGADSIGIAVFLLCAVVLMVSPPQPMAWDARSIWWFHAAWFQAGGDVVVEAMRNPIMTFGHPEYPNGVPAFIGTVWALFGGENLELAMQITAVLSAMAVALLVATIFDRSRVDSASVVVPLVLGVAIVMQGQGLAAAGYLDVLCASFTALAYVWFVRDRRASAMSVSALMAATFTKVEGLYFGVVLCAVAGTWVERRGRFALVVGATIVPALVWMVTVRALTPDLVTDVRPSGFVRLVLLDGARWSRGRDAAPRVLGKLWPYLLAGAGATAGLWATSRNRPTSALTLSLGCLAGSVLTAAATVLVYAAGLPEIHWWLDTSLERVVVTPRVLALIAVAVPVHQLGRFDQLDGVRTRTPLQLNAPAID